ncbi:RCC1-like domain-containing protein [Shewanella japonica]|uniref:RCC1-like domain-containing protein n=1 Tax=Shewanella japonica TaxID=93973 RepID=UPI002494B69A|nr:hypothetical protein [Shewanella japonica]
MRTNSYLLAFTISTLVTASPFVSASTIKTYQDISTSSHFSVAVTTDGKLYGWGNNSTSNAKFGTEGMDENAYSTPTLLAEELDIVWQKAYANQGGVLSLTDDGKLLSWGLNHTCQTGQGEEDTSLTLLPAVLDIDSDSAFVEVTGSYTDSYLVKAESNFALTSSGELWAWGYNNNGQLGDGAQDQQCAPIKITTEQSFTSVSSSYTHTLAIDDAGEIWGWGGNYYSQYSSEEGSNTPLNTATGKQWVKVAAGSQFSFAIDAQGALYVRGYDSNSMSGVSGYPRYEDWTQIDGTQTWVDIKIGARHVIALDSEGNIWSWGENSSGQLGFTDLYEKITSPTLIESNHKWQSIEAHGSNSSFALREDNTGAGERTQIMC